MAEPKKIDFNERGGRGSNSRRSKGVDDVAESLLESKGADEFAEKVVFINRTAKVVKGGRRFHFSALVVVGDKKGKVGVGFGKAGEVSDAIRKGSELAKRNMVTVALREGTIPHEVFARFGGAEVLLKPASLGTGVIAGKTPRAVLELAGVRDVLSKSLGSSNPVNVVKATVDALKSLRLREEIYQVRGKEIKKPETTQSNQEKTEEVKQ